MHASMPPCCFYKSAAAGGATFAWKTCEETLMTLSKAFSALSEIANKSQPRSLSGE